MDIDNNRYMYRVKVTVASSDKGFCRQLPKGELIWNGYKFFVNEDVEEADFWVVCYQRLPNNQETCRVAPENTIYITWEPDSVYHFSQGFLNQFGKVVSCQEHLKHRNLVKDHPGLGWHMGMVIKDGKATYTKTYDDFLNTTPEKTKLISVISSNKAFTKGHRERMEFVQKLKVHFGDQLDVYGRGLKSFDDKWDVIAPYKYHIALENCSIPYYWSEKLADSFLGNAFTFYYGCTNVDDYFDNRSFRAIDLHDADAAIKIIDKAIAEGLAEKNADAVQESKLRVLTQENFFAVVVRHLQGMNTDAPKQVYTIRHDLAFFDLKKLPLYANRVISNLKFKYRN